MGREICITLHVSACRLVKKNDVVQMDPMVSPSKCVSSDLASSSVPFRGKVAFSPVTEDASIANPRPLNLKS